MKLGKHVVGLPTEKYESARQMLQAFERGAPVKLASHHLDQPVDRYDLKDAGVKHVTLRFGTIERAFNF